MGDSLRRISTGNLPENPEKPSKKGSWVPVGQRTSQRDQCDGCGHSKTPGEFSKFYAKDMSLDADEEIQFLCNYCADYGAPLADPMAALTAKERKGMLIMASGGTVAAGARSMDISKEKLRDELNGRERGVFREAFQRILASDGLGPEAVAAALGRAIVGKKLQFKPDTGEFIEVDDYAAQMRATDMLIKIWDLKPPQELARNVDGSPGTSGVTVNIQTNVGDGKEAKGEEYEITGVVTDE